MTVVEGGPRVGGSPAHVLITGATGMIGGTVLRLALDNAAVTSVTTLGRRPVRRSHPKLRDVQHANFTDYRGAEAAFDGCDLAFFCLGVYTSAVSDEELRRVTVEYVAAFARTLQSRSPRATVCLLSGQGADQTEQSRVPFCRYKGAAEKALLAAGFPRVHLVRPGYIYPVTPRQEPNLGYRLLRAMYPLASRIYPAVGVTSDEVARAMVHVGLGHAGDEATIVAHHDIRPLARRYTS